MDEQKSELENIQEIKCQVGDKKMVNAKQDNSSPSRSDGSSGAKVKRKTRSSRRRLQAMMNNTSLHFSDTDSEGELTMITAQGPKSKFSPINPVISITHLDDNGQEKTKSMSLTVEGNNSGRSSRRSSFGFVDNLTDVDEIYSDTEDAPNGPKGVNKGSKNLTVETKAQGGETDLEDMSDAEEDVHAPIYVTPRSDILSEFFGETITTKEGDGPFSVEVRNKLQSVDIPMSIDIPDTPDIIVVPTTDSEDMEASDDDEEELAGAYGPRELVVDEFNNLGSSQTIMKNDEKSVNLLNVKDNTPPDDISDCHTDVEDVE